VLFKIECEDGRVQSTKPLNLLIAASHSQDIKMVGAWGFEPTMKETDVYLGMKE
jgi:hypothetical protein